MEVADTLFGYSIPFPRQDLYVALATVIGFLPAVVILHAIIVRLLQPFTKSKPE